MSDNKSDINQNFLSGVIEVVNVAGVNYISAENLSRALGINSERVIKVLLSAVKRIKSDAAIISVNSQFGSILLCNARGFVEVAHELLHGPAAKERQSAVLDALLKGSESLCNLHGKPILAIDVLTLRLAMTETWLEEAEAKLSRYKAQEVA